MVERQGYIEIDMSYNGLHKFFNGMYNKGVTEIGMSVEDLTVQDAELLNMVASEYFYIVIDIQTKGKLTDIVIMSE